MISVIGPDVGLAIALPAVAIVILIAVLLGCKYRRSRLPFARWVFYFEAMIKYVELYNYREGYKSFTNRYYDFIIISSFRLHRTSTTRDEGLIEDSVCDDSSKPSVV